MRLRQASAGSSLFEAGPSIRVTPADSRLPWGFPLQSPRRVVSRGRRVQPARNARSRTCSQPGRDSRLSTKSPSGATAPPSGGSVHDPTGAMGRDRHFSSEKHGVVEARVTAIEGRHDGFIRQSRLLARFRVRQLPDAASMGAVVLQPMETGIETDRRDDGGTAGVVRPHSLTSWNDAATNEDPAGAGGTIREPTRHERRAASTASRKSAIREDH